MNEGEITFQGTFDEVARSNPELYQRWQQDVIAATDSELSDGLSGEESTLEEEREILRRRVSENLMKSNKEISMSKSVLEPMEGKPEFNFFITIANDNSLYLFLDLLCPC